MRSDDASQGNIVLFIEAEEWERAELTRQFPHNCRVVATHQRLEELPDAEIPSNVTILSCFIHSKITADQLDRLPRLQFIATRSTGYDHIDMSACADRGILVANVPHYGENTVAEHAFAMLLALTRKIHRCYERTVRGDFNIDGLRGEDLFGKTFGALGAGNIARHALRIAKGFGMRLLACDVVPDEALARQIGFEYVSFDDLLRRSDVLSIHVPYNDATHHLVDATALAKLPAGAIVINTARGGIIDPSALIEALSSGHLAGAALDVLEAEAAIAEEAEIMSSDYDLATLQAVVANHALLRMPNVIITPHVAFNSTQAVRRIINTTIANVHAFLDGHPQNLVIRSPQAA